jgi:hypothetical protein
MNTTHRISIFVAEEHFTLASSGLVTGTPGEDRDVVGDLHSPYLRWLGSSDNLPK